jgi:hypothetical protein
MVTRDEAAQRGTGRRVARDGNGNGDAGNGGASGAAARAPSEFESAERRTVAQTARLNARVRRDPTDAEAWLRFADFQYVALRRRAQGKDAAATRRLAVATAERTVAILEKAIAAVCAPCWRLERALLDAAAPLRAREETARAWEAALRAHEALPAAWIAALRRESAQRARFALDRAAPCDGPR